MGRKYKTKFPMARIKKIMQLDHEIGKVALATPILISKALEIFMQSLVDATAERARQAESTKLEPIFLKNSIFETEQFDFLKDIVAGVEEKPARNNTSDDSPKKAKAPRNDNKDDDTSNQPDDSPSPSTDKVPKRAKKSTVEESTEKDMKFIVYSAVDGTISATTSTNTVAATPTATPTATGTDSVSAPKTAIASMLNDESITPTLEPIN